MTSDNNLSSSQDGRRCLRCGAELGSGNEVYCSAAELELQRRGVPHGLEPHSRLPVTTVPGELIPKYTPRASEADEND